MKRSFTSLLVFFLLMLSSFCFGQTPNGPQKFNFGIKAGVNLSFFSTNISPYGVDESLGFNPTVRIFPAFALFGKENLNNWLSLRAELAYSGKGGSYRCSADDIVSTGGNTNDNYYYQNFLLNYYELPIILDISTAIRGHAFTLGFGLAPMYNASSKLRYNYYNENVHQSSYGYTSVSENYHTEKFDYANKYNYSWIVDLTFDDNSEKLGYTLGFRYSHTFNNVYSVNELDGYNMKSKMGTLSFILGVYI